eukprot:TRINITY_DN3735_c0_g1_i5.p1 TRINITY_DN3735_c0_g1~~TRINITY_DN3735_c0_g1_i5.p1  ORF type:complete len:448 (-),score=118.01 TRINITY_DN3735_c0_g1_i5:2-1345(-)
MCIRDSINAEYGEPNAAHMHTHTHLPLLTALLLLCLAALCPATLQLSDWMGQAMPVIGEQSLLDLSLPGTHDTFTYDLSRTMSDGGIDGGDAWAEILHDLTAAGIVPDLVTDFVRANAQTQSLTITEQLDNGIRFLDFRNMYEHTSKQWYDLHMLQTNTASLEYLKQIRAWMDAHPSEVLVMWMSKHGSQCATGDDQYPDVTQEQKTAYWQSIEAVFAGVLMDSSKSSPATTPLKQLVSSSQRMLIYAGDYESFTSSSRFALDSCLIENQLGPSNPVRSLKFWRNKTKHGVQAKAAWKKKGKFWLMSGAQDQGGSLSPEVAMHFAICTETKKYEHRQDCANALEIPNVTAFCPEALLGFNQLANYYRQEQLHDILDPSCQHCDLPNAMYIDAVDHGGTIRTGLQLLSADPSAPVCDMFEWTHCSFKNDGCPAGYLSLIHISEPTRPY